MKTIFLSILASLALSSQLAFPQSHSNEYTCLFYNLENMFHPSDEATKSDDDFTPEGTRRWTFYRYHKKLTQICKVILAANNWNPPDLICVSELENRQVLENIIAHPLLMKNEYQILHRDSPDHRGIDVAILYRKDKLTCIDTTWLKSKDKKGRCMKTREILCAKFLTDHDTLLCAVNHWTSKYGGALETEDKRISQARRLGNHIDSVVLSQPGILVIAGGDFNDASEAKSIQILQKEFVLKEVLPLKGDYTYKYHGKWESVDHAFIGGSLSSDNCKVAVVKIPFLLEEDEKYTGSMPFRTYRGFAYNGGISDHLPLLVHIDLGRYSDH